jgi:hypothetical protein
MRIAKLLITAALASSSLAYSASSSPIPLGDSRSFPAEHVSVLTAVVKYLNSQKVSLSDLQANIFECDDKKCAISIYSQETSAPDSRGDTRGCSIKYCTTLIYDKSLGTITKSIGRR